MSQKSKDGQRRIFRKISSGKVWVDEQTPQKEGSRKVEKSKKEKGRDRHFGCVTDKILSRKECFRRM
jgi:hypothetical protein